MVDKAKENQFIAAVHEILVPAGWDPLIPYAHAAHESGWFEKMVGLNNFWGLQYPRTQWRRDTIDLEPIRIPTTEYITSGRAAADPKWFAGWINYHLEDMIRISYDTRLERFKFGVYKKFCDWSREPLAVKYYGAHIKSLWPEAYANRQNAERYFPGLFNDDYKFATDDPEEYCKNCMSIYRQLKAAL